MLKSWSKEHFGSVKHQIAKKKESLWKAEEAVARGGSYDLVILLRRELNILLEKESQMWRQRSRLKWVAHGDQNTKYFHGVATQRKRKNFIKGVRDSDGQWQIEEEVLSGVFVDFYTKLFSSSDVTEIDQVLEGVQKVVTDDMTAELQKPYSKEEVDVAIKQMAPSKAPGRMGCPLSSSKLFGSTLVGKLRRLSSHA